MAVTDPTRDVRIVVLTSGGDYAQRVLLNLALKQITPVALVLARSPLLSSRRALTDLFSASPKQLAMRLVGRASGWIESACFQSDRWAGLAEKVQYAGRLNENPLLAILRSAKPDYLLLARIGVLRSEILSIPTKATVNVHPALLPWARGLSAIERSLERHVPVGVTLHYVDSGIDTGGIIRRELIHVAESDTVGSLRRKAYERCAQLMAEFAAAVGRGEPPKATLHHGRYPYCNRISAAESAHLDRAVTNGLAVKLYREWLEVFGSSVLPNNRNDFPRVQVEPIAK